MTDKKILAEMGARISSRRKSLKLTQEQVADGIDVSVQMISNLELGKKAIRPENLIKLCAVLGISSDYILFGSTRGNPVDQMVEKLYTLPESKRRLVEQVIDLCLQDGAER